MHTTTPCAIPTGPQNPDLKAQTNLIVNYLPQTMSEEEVRNLFGQIGQILSCKLIKDKNTSLSLGYAFVNYTDTDDAEKAIQQLNGLPLHNKTIKVSYARPSSNSIKNANLYVAYLPKTFSQLQLETLFSPFGNIITSKILVDETGESKGVGFVRFDTNSEAQKALVLNGNLLPGCTQPIVVKFANQPRTGAGETSAPVNPRRTGGLGPIRNTLANVRFNPVSALTSVPAISTLTSLVPPVASSGATATPLQPGSTGGGGNSFCVFVYNLPETAQESLLYQLFAPYGAIHSVKVIIDPQTKKCKRYGFVNMVNYSEAYQAIMNLNGHDIEPGKKLQVSFKKGN